MMKVEDIKPSVNYILVRVDKFREDQIELSGGITIYLDNTFEEEEHYATTATVASVCDKLHFTKDRHSKSGLKYDSDIEIQPGDTCWFSYLTLFTSNTKGQVIKCDDGKYYAFIKYDEVHCVKRGDKIIPVNGFILCKPIYDDRVKSKFLELPEHTRRRASDSFAMIEHIGRPVRAYKHYPNHYDANVPVSKGDVVMLEKNSDIPLQYALHNNLDGSQTFYRVQRKDLVGITTMNVVQENFK